MTMETEGHLIEGATSSWNSNNSDDKMEYTDDEQRRREEGATKKEREEKVPQGRVKKSHLPQTGRACK